MGKLKRYWIGHDHWNEIPNPDVIECHDGDWVKADDAQAAIQALADENARLREQLTGTIQLFKDVVLANGVQIALASAMGRGDANIAANLRGQRAALQVAIDELEKILAPSQTP